MSGTDYDESAEDRELLRLYRESSGERLPARVAEAARAAWRRRMRRPVAGLAFAAAGLAAALVLAILPSSGPIRPRPSPAEIGWDPPAIGGAPVDLGFDRQLRVDRARMDGMLSPRVDFDRDMMDFRRRLDAIAVDARKF